MPRVATAHRRLLGAGLGLVFLVAACGSTTPTPDRSPDAGSGAPAASSEPGTTAGDDAVVDATLLDVLPAAIEGFPMTADDETAGEIAADPTTDPAVRRIAVGVFVDPSDPVEADLAVVSVVALRPGTFDDAWFRSWRETYDAAACEVAEGVSPGSAEATIAGHRTFIGKCRGGVHTYHVHLADPDRLIAITSLGTGRFGEQVVAGLTE
jgi:hypothetical protein